MYRHTYIVTPCRPSSIHPYSSHSYVFQVPHKYFISWSHSRVSGAGVINYLVLLLLLPALVWKSKNVGRCPWCHAKNAQHNKSPNPRKQIYFNSLLDIAMACPVPSSCCCCCFFPSLDLTLPISWASATVKSSSCCCWCCHVLADTWRHWNEHLRQIRRGARAKANNKQNRTEQNSL